MKASEALRLGSMLIPPMRGVIGGPGKPGCALGMIGEAAGMRHAFLHTQGCVIHFPILDARVVIPNGRVPVCGCSVETTAVHNDTRLSAIIVHLFDTHVDAPHGRGYAAQGLLKEPRVTVEQIADWLESVERDHTEPVAPSPEVPVGFEVEPTN